MSNVRPSFMRSHSGVITIYSNKSIYNVNTDHANYRKIVDLLASEGPYEGLNDLINVAQAIIASVERTGTKKVTIQNGEIFFDGEVVHNTVADRILQFQRESFPFDGLVKFLENLMENPSKASLDNLYRFLEHNKMVITEDGHFLAYKRVRGDYKDIHSNTFDNSPGKVCEVPRNKVQDDPSVTCSFGLHVAALHYARDSYGGAQGERLIIVKINPKDVVSVPTDYNNSKMRVCRYEVVEDFTKELEQKDITAPLPLAREEELDDYDDYEDEDDSCLDEMDSEWDDEDESDDDEEDEEDDNYSPGYGYRGY